MKVYLKIISFSMFFLLSFFTMNGCGKIKQLLTGKKSQEETLVFLETKWGEIVKKKLLDKGIEFPPTEIVLIGLKEEKTLEVWAKKEDSYTKLGTYKVLAASGKKGPKLREGDKQVPEGFYNIEYLNPNSSFHLSMKVSYPNEFDLAKAKEDNRDKPGSDIFIHGSQYSIGCLAIGDESIEELYYLVSKTGYANVKVLLLPYDFRLKKISTEKADPTWLYGLYQELETKMHSFPN